MSNLADGPWGGVNSIPQSEMNWGTTTREPRNELDRDAFLQLLIVQLQHQDPLNPMDDRDFIAQMAQFSALEQMVQLNQTFERTQAFGMIGQIVEFSFPHPITGEWIDDYGLVTAVTRQGNNVFLVVNDMDVPFDAVREVRSDFLIDEVMMSMFQHIVGQRAQDMVGRYVQAVIPGAEGSLPIFVEGRVDSLRLAGNGQVFLSVNGHEVQFPQGVVSVSDQMLLIGSNAFTHGTVTGVEFQNVTIDGERATAAYLVFNNGSARARINLLNLATDAVALINNSRDANGVPGMVGPPIRHAGIEGMPVSIEMVGGIPFINVTLEDGSNGRIDFAAFMVARSGGGSSSGGESEGGSGSDAGNDDE